MSKLIKDSSYDQDKDLLRSQFVEQYSSSKGWDASKLTNEQLKEIKDQQGYKNPGMILG